MKKKEKDVRNRVVSRPTDEQETRSFGVRRIVSYNYEEYESRGELEIGEGDHRTEGWDVAKRIFDVEGVQHVHTDQYQIYVTIGTAFGWWKDQIESKVIKAIESYLETLSLLDDAGPEEKNKGIT